MPATPILIAETRRNRLAKIAVAQNENHTKPCEYAIPHATAIMVSMAKILEAIFLHNCPNYTVLISYVRNTPLTENS